MIALKFGADKKHIKVNSKSKLDMNLIYIHSAMNIYLHKASNFCHGYSHHRVKSSDPPIQRKADTQGFTLPISIPIYVYDSYQVTFYIIYFIDFSVGTKTTKYKLLVMTKQMTMDNQYTTNDKYSGFIRSCMTTI